MAVKKDIAAAMKEAEKLMNRDGVVGIGQGKNKKKDCIKVFITLPEEDISPPLPAKIQGFDVIVDFTEPLQALDNFIL